jgi:cell division protein FtsB
MESKLDDQTQTYEQKIRYLKQEVEMKKLQIDNMKRLIDIRDSSNERNPLASSQPLKPGFSHSLLGG